MMENSSDLSVKNILGTIWFLFLCACAAAYLGWIDVPKPIVAIWDRFNGNSAETFAQLSKHFPDNQSQFVSKIVTHREDYRSAQNDLAKGATRISRKQEICRIVNDTTNGEWAGVVDTLSSNGDGYGVLAVKIAPDILLKTWNNSLSDLGSGTLIEPGSDIHTTAAQLAVGDHVKFTGTFLSDDIDCITESSLTLDGSMTAPEFIVRFRSIRKI